MSVSIALQLGCVRGPRQAVYLQQLCQHIGKTPDMAILPVCIVSPLPPEGWQHDLPAGLKHDVPIYTL